MTQSQVYNHPQFLNHICKLHKSLYGLRQAPRPILKLSKKLKSLHFQESQADNSLFISNRKIEMIYILIYVNNISITGSNSTIIDSTIASLKKSFVVKELGDLHFFLSVEATQIVEGLYLTERKYNVDFLKRSNMDKTKPCSTPMASTCHLTASDGPPFADAGLYRSIVGSMQYLAFTRPDLAFVVHKVSKFMHKPMEPYWQAIKQILQYLKYTVSTGLLITKAKNFRL